MAKILLVDDAEFMRMMLKNTLTQQLKCTMLKSLILYSWTLQCRTRTGWRH